MSLCSARDIFSRPGDVDLVALFGLVVFVVVFVMFAVCRLFVVLVGGGGGGGCGRFVVGVVVCVCVCGGRACRLYCVCPLRSLI